MQSSVNLRGLTWQEVELTGPATCDLEELEAYLSAFKVGGWVVEAEPPHWRWVLYMPCVGRWRARWEELLAGLAQLGVAARVRQNIVDEDWAECWKRYYHPLRFGRHLVVCPSWERATFQAAEGDKVLVLDPGMAFGTGSHATTALCLELLEKYLPQLHPPRLLDVGTGSGILALAAALLGVPQIVASDSDPVAVKVAQENCELNKLEDRIEILEFIGVPLDQGTFPVVCANLVASLLCRLSAPLAQALTPQGVLIASGIVLEREEEVVEAMAQEGLVVKERCLREGWVALVLGKKD